MLRENYYALYVSIVKGVTPNQAFALLGTKQLVEEEAPKRPQKKWNITEIMIMQRMRQKGRKWDEIGKQFGISPQNARSIVMYRTKGETDEN